MKQVDNSRNAELIRMADLSNILNLQKHQSMCRDKPFCTMLKKICLIKTKISTKWCHSQFQIMKQISILQLQTKHNLCLMRVRYHTNHLQRSREYRGSHHNHNIFSKRKSRISQLKRILTSKYTIITKKTRQTSLKCLNS